MLQRGTLWARLTRRTGEALRRGALHPMPTDRQIVEQDGVRFVVRVLPQLARKEEARREQERQAASSGREVNPFLPHDPDLFVADLSHTHVGLLNKFNVLDRHLLIVTRSFEDQECPLDTNDFEALWTCMAEFEGLGFYNSGEIAGASQRHKHLQMVPLPLAPGLSSIPIEPLIAEARFRGPTGTAPRLPFLHAVVRVEPHWLRSPREAATESLESYRAMLRAVGLGGDREPAAVRRPRPYNLLVTRNWMLLVPRSRESFRSISVNSLGFAGALLVRDEAQLNALRGQGPMTALRSVGVAKRPPGAT